jgi:hypothetical protein
MADVQFVVNVWRQGEDICLVKGDEFITTINRGSSPWRYLDRLLRDSDSASPDAPTGWNEGYGEKEHTRAIPRTR